MAKLGRKPRNQTAAKKQINTHFTPEEAADLSLLKEHYPGLSPESTTADIVRVVLLNEAAKIKQKFSEYEVFTDDKKDAN